MAATTPLHESKDFATKELYLIDDLVASAEALFEAFERFVSLYKFCECDTCNQTNNLGNIKACQMRSKLTALFKELNATL